jgi:catechol 2,3-dioxygenase-like lactoylglutathione lyase family enzyme
VAADRPDDRRVDRGVTHLALPVRDLETSLDFYARFAGMHVVHRRAEPGGNAVAWISDLTRPFVLVLIETGTALDPEQRLGGTFSHIGFAVGSRADVDTACELARAEGRSVFGPNDYGPPVGYWAYIVDPDGHNLELSYGQEVGLAVDEAR